MNRSGVRFPDPAQIHFYQRFLRDLWANHLGAPLARRQLWAVTTAVPEPFTRLLRSWSRHLTAANKSPNTISLYIGAGELLGTFLAERGGATDPAQVTRADVEAFIADLLATRSASTAATRYRSLQQFFRWLVLEAEIDRSPMEGMQPPKLEEKPVPVVGIDDLSAFPTAAGGKDFEARRDTAIMRVFIHTGIRAGEMTGLTVRDVDLDRRLIVVTGKGRRTRGVGRGGEGDQGPGPLHRTGSSESPTGCARRRCGSVAAAHRRRRGFPRCSAVGATRRASTASTLISSVTPSLVCGWPRVGESVI